MIHHLKNKCSSLLNLNIIKGVSKLTQDLNLSFLYQVVGNSEKRTAENHLLDVLFHNPILCTL